MLAGCLGLTHSPAYYVARQSVILSATEQAFTHAQIPIAEVSNGAVRSAEFQATDVWSDEQIRERLNCGDASEQRFTSPSAVTLSMSGQVNEDPRNEQPMRTGDRNLVTRYDATLRLSGKGTMISRGGSKTRCSISAEFVQQLIDDVALIAGVPARRTKNGTPTQGVPTIPAIPGRGGSPHPAPSPR
jgi:hypothetical protein